MTRYLLVVLAGLVFSGCPGAALQLDASYAPLVQVQEDTAVNPAVITTIFGTVYVNNLETWLRNNSTGPSRDASLLHERVHAVRQYSGGVFWFARYLAEPSFRWAEEQAGWHIGLQVMRRNLLGIDPPSVATFLSTAYTIAGVPMVSYEDALAWVNAELAGP